MKKNYSTFSFGKSLRMAMIVIMSMFAANSYAQLVCAGGSPTAPGSNYSIVCDPAAFQQITAGSVSNSISGTVALTSLGGVVIPNTLAGLTPFIGKVIVVTVTDAGNSCWGYLKVEDKQAPSIVCPTNITLTCDQVGLLLTPGSTGQFLGATNQYAGSRAIGNGTTDECSKYEQSFVDIATVPLTPCGGGVITRTFRLKDIWGNTSATCAQTITVLAPAAFVAPTFTNFTLQCQNVSAAQKADLLAGRNITGVTTPSVTGCGLTLNYVSSRELAMCPGSYKITRIYEVVNMCGTPMINGPYEQVIQVVDQTSPTAGSTYQNFGVIAGTYCFYMQGMLMNTAPSNYTQEIRAEVPLTRPFHTRLINGVVVNGVAASGTTLGSVATVQLTPRGDDNMCGAARVFFTVAGEDLNCSNGNIVYTSNDSRIRFGSGAGTTTATAAAGVSVNVSGFIMTSQGTAFTIFATDACGNVSSQNYNVNIVDNVSPQPVCIQIHRATLNSNGTVRVYAPTFNNGSSDNCGIERIHVRRMDKRNSTGTVCNYATVATSTSCSSTDIRDFFNDYVDFDCGDAGRTDVMVQVRYIDASGNFSDCMVNVIVDDKTKPVCVSPTGITRLCTDNDLLNYKALFTTPAAYDNCGIARVDTTDSPNLAIRCSASTATRTWTFTDCQGNSTACSQTLTVNPRLGFRVTRLANETPSCSPAAAVNATFLEAERIKVINNLDLVDCNGNRTCSAPVVEVESWEFSSSQYCKIFRIRYTIIDNCMTPFAPYSGPEWGSTPGSCTSTVPGSPVIQDRAGAIVFERYIQVNDTQAPTSADVALGAICDGSSTDADGALNCIFGVNVTLVGADACNTNTAASTPSNLYYIWKLQRLNATTGVFGDVAGFGNTNPVITSLRGLAFGSYRIVYRITDLCGNVSSEYFVTFSGADCKGPEILVHNKIVALGGVTGISSSGMAGLNYADIRNRITDNCDGDLTNDSKIVLERVLSTDPTQPLMPRNDAAARPKRDSVSFTCADLGNQLVRVWARDNSTTPINWNFVISVITVQDNDGICGVRPLSILGMIGTENNSAVKDVVMTANANGSLMGSNTSTAAGTFAITNLPVGSYQVRAAKSIDTDKKNGVTTLDIALISKHNLGIEALNSPYKVIAADVNRDNEVDGTDMLHIRRFILGITSTLADNSAWRFVDKRYAFRNAANPLGEDFPEVVSLTNAPAGVSTANFVAVKAGDVNNSFDASQVRGSRALVFNTNDLNVVAGNEYTVAINAANFNAAAFQGTFAFEGATVKAVKAGNLNNTSDANFAMFKNAVAASWNGQSEASADVMMITFVATKSGKLSEMLTVNSSVTLAEGYDATGNAMNVTLKFNTGKVAGGEFALYQNTPNPVALSTKVGFNLPKDGQAKLTIYTTEGKVLSVINNTYKAGYNEVTINKSDLNASGMLYYRLDTQDNSSTRKMIIIE